MGTNERVKQLEIFNYIGLLALKLAFELDIEVMNSNVIIIGGGLFGDSTFNTFKKMGAKVLWIKPTLGEKLTVTEHSYFIKNSDLLVFVEYETKNILMGKDGPITYEEILRHNSSISIVHIAGSIELPQSPKKPIRINPKQIKNPGYMSVTTAYLGPKPIIDLHTAGLKVGEAMARARIQGLSCIDAKKKALETSPAQDFMDPIDI